MTDPPTEGPVSLGPRSLPPPGMTLPAPPPGSLYTRVPGLWVLRHYRAAYLRDDVVAGLVLTALLVPAGMAYAEAAGLPAVTGLYATIAPLVAYAIFGPSRIMVLGPDSALAGLVASAIAQKAHGDPERAMELAAVLALLTGATCVAAGLLKAGFVTDLLSKPVRVGYTNGIAVVVLVSQLPRLCGFSAGGGNVLESLAAFARGVAEGKAKPQAIAIGLGGLGLILVLKKKAKKIPGVLFAVVGAIAATKLAGLASTIPVVGEVPHGFPTPKLPSMSWDDLGDLLVASLGIALLSFADTTVLSRTFAARGRYKVDASQELVGLGLANVAAGLFRGFPISASSSRTPVAEASGAKSQVTGIVGALAIVLVLLLAPGALKDLPTTALAAVVIAAAIGLFDLKAMRGFKRFRFADFVLSLVALGSVAFFGALRGIAFAVAVSLLDFVRRAWRPHDAVLGRAPGVKGYHDIRRYPKAVTVPGLLLFRWDAPLFFANADSFRERVMALVGESSLPIRWVVVAAEPITDVDTTAADMLEELDKELAAYGAELAFAELKDPVKDRLERYGLHARIGHEFFFPTVGVAVKAYVERHDVPWSDWENEAAKQP